MGNPYRLLNEVRGIGSSSTEAQRLLIVACTAPDPDKLGIIERLIEHNMAMAWDEGVEQSKEDAKYNLGFQITDLKKEIAQLRESKDYWHRKYLERPKAVIITQELADIAKKHLADRVSRYCRISAIKEIRDKAQLGLSDSKNIVDAVWNTELDRLQTEAPSLLVDDDHDKAIDEYFQRLVVEANSYGLCKEDPGYNTKHFCKKCGEWYVADHAVTPNHPPLCGAALCGGTIYHGKNSLRYYFRTGV